MDQAVSVGQIIRDGGVLVVLVGVIYAFFTGKVVTAAACDKREQACQTACDERVRLAADGQKEGGP